MGYGQITAGGPDGRYTIRMDYGEARKTATLAALNAQLVKLDADIVAVQAVLVAKQKIFQAESAAVNAATEQYIAATRAATAPQIQEESDAITSAAEQDYLDAQANRAQAQADLSAAESALAALDEQIATLTADLQAAEEARNAGTDRVLVATSGELAARAGVDSAQAAANAAEAAYLAKVAAEEDATAEAAAMGDAQSSLSAHLQQLDVARQETLEATQDLAELQDDVNQIQADLESATADRPAAVELIEMRTVLRDVALASERVAERVAEQSKESNTAIKQGATLATAQANAQQQLIAAKNRLAQAQRDLAPANLQLASSKGARAQVLDLITRWSAAVVTETKQAWCTDFTEDGAGYVATIDINGQSDLTLIAPGCRPWAGGDGTIATAVKAAKLAALNDLKARHENAQAQVEADITVTKAKAEAAATARDDALRAYNLADPGPLQLQALQDFEAKAKIWRDLMADLAKLEAERAQIVARISAVTQDIVLWSAKPASENPKAGDGFMVATDVMTPTEYFVNRAIMPGWQKWKPTYRWGTLTTLDKDNDTATVSLADARSSEQNLGINQSSTLSNVPVLYMTCNARAFEEGDRVVVEFEGQDWSRPRVIGFLDNPKPCIQYLASYYVIGYGPFSSGNNHLFDTLERDKDEDWGNFTSVTPAAPWRFVQWSDGVTSLTRNDGTATESISRTARYTYAPNFRVTYTWTVEAYATSGVYFSEGNFVKDWEVRVTGSVAWSAIGGVTPPTSPVSGAVDSVVWSGQALSGIGPDQVLFNLTDTYLGETNSGGPIYFPAFPSGTTQTVVFVLAGSANQYSVVGTAGTNPFPGGVIPPSASGTGAVTTVDYTATSWSAVYA